MPYDHVQSKPVSVALVQMTCTEAKEPNVEKALARIAEAAGSGAQHRLPAGAVRRAILLPERRPSPVRRGRADSRADERGPGRRGEEAWRRRRRLALRAAGAGPVSQHGGRLRCRRLAGRHVSQDAHSRRSAVLREVLLHAGRPRLPELRHEVRPRRRLRLLGPVVSRSGPADGADRRARSSSIPRPSAGCPTRRTSSARASTTPGKR